ncbi:MAG: molybdenum cofactor biosynthesis protein MoaE [Methanomicrobiales archaeon]|nr:molybdenum cofactor biosynthesis protein MoaE [Methanomicrobiales archaeon]NYT20710.1 molybdenum cofactor biosynthesis protein MoaE [Methanomicrobiales archaeon]
MITITDEDFDPGACIDAARDPRVGGIVTFTGIVRDDGITSIELETYREAALQELGVIRDEALSRYDIRSVDIIHRVGPLAIGDHIVVITVGAPHRRDAFDACEYIIDRIKETVPIWKKEHTAEGSRWVPGEHS